MNPRSEIISILHNIFGNNFNLNNCSWELDNYGQVIIFTSKYKWRDKSFHDKPEIQQDGFYDEYSYNYDYYDTYAEDE
jgi:hypothetical protein